MNKFFIIFLFFSALTYTNEKEKIFDINNQTYFRYELYQKPLSRILAEAQTFLQLEDQKQQKIVKMIIKQQQENSVPLKKIMPPTSKKRYLRNKKK